MPQLELEHSALPSLITSLFVAARTSRAVSLKAAGLPICEPSPSSTSQRLLVLGDQDGDYPQV